MIDLRPAALDSWPARDQADPEIRANSCVAFATTALHELKRFVNSIQDLSEASLILVTANKGATGIKLRHAILALENSGQLSRVEYRQLVQSGSASVLLTSTDLSWKRARMARIEASPQNILRQLQQGNPVLLGLELMSSLFFADQRGIVHLEDGDLPRGGYHAVGVIGQAVVGGGDYFLIRNSWGIGWARGGYALLSTAYVQKYGKLAVVVDELL
ncbi:hypothetical protein OG921_04570 [Aldersonia sp. NBC_00410]|uniref:C1 family peptidase n=1 Tax=Aldersonia sp. NBC_00410 TaxID=2975954 RepID=UPI002257C6DE|nr:C1 family peptidase [Aldersonia sp. NBC_00410]MCX5042448.1 hypothetical protein [Aldersonia sp. NBC_00410]